MNRLSRLAAVPILAALLVAAAPAGPAGAVDVTLKRAYGSYRSESGPPGGDWDQPVFTAATSRLIRQWKRHNGEELTGLSSYGWFCECQDWQASKFRYRRDSLRQIAPGKVEVKVSVDPGFGDYVQQRLILVREGKRWLIDDLFSQSAPSGVKAEMRQELTEVPGQ
ncbi:MAG TPA: hypothetical protein PK680_03370 [Novosphingobium sp.]|nr:hypothetical protein [Novosphingobium sp.]